MTKKPFKAKKAVNLRNFIAKPHLKKNKMIIESVRDNLKKHIQFRRPIVPD